jgi:hypothetical protein
MTTKEIIEKLFVQRMNSGLNGRPFIVGIDGLWAELERRHL